LSGGVPSFGVPAGGEGRGDKNEEV